MERQPVRATQIAAIGYEPATRVLEVEFVNGSIYQYDFVSVGLYNELLAAESPEHYFAEHIRPGFVGHRMPAAAKLD